MAPLPALDPDCEDEESAEQTAEAHLNFFTETLKYYNLDLSEWVVCHCADSASVNIKIAKLSHGNHNPCDCHKLALGSNDMMERDSSLKETVDKCAAAGTYVQNSAKVQTHIRNLASAIDAKLSNLTAKSKSTTRQWLGGTIILRQHQKLAPYYSQLIDQKVGKMRDHKDTVDVDFLDTVTDKMKYMGPIRQASEHIQTHGMSLCKTQGALDTLSSRVARQKGKPGETSTTSRFFFIF